MRYTIYMILVLLIRLVLFGCSNDVAEPNVYEEYFNHYTITNNVYYTNGNVVMISMSLVVTNGGQNRFTYTNAPELLILVSYNLITNTDDTAVGLWRDNFWIDNQGYLWTLFNASPELLGDHIFYRMFFAIKE